MFIHTLWALRIFGLAGVLGAGLMMAGDLLYSYIPGSQESHTRRMSQLPESRLLLGGVMGLLGCWCYVLTSLQVYLAFNPAGELFAFLLALAFAALMICYGIAHTAYFAIPTGAKAALQLGGDAEEGGRLGNLFFQRMVTITYIPVVISTLMMAYAILTGASLYPRWMAALLPVVIYLLRPLVTRLFWGRPREWVSVAYDNFAFFVYFILVTVVLWNASVV